MGDNHQVYISYAWGGESERIVNELDADLQSKGILVVRDKRDLGFKGMIRDFMQQIGRGHAVIVVISDKYLKSPNCMYELVEIARNKDFYDRVFPIVLGDADTRVGLLAPYDEENTPAIFKIERMNGADDLFTLWKRHPNSDRFNGYAVERGAFRPT